MMLKDFEVFSLEPVSSAGFEFKISQNNYEDGILVVAKNDFLSYNRVRYFSTSDEAREWVSSLVSTTKAMYEHLIQN